MVSEAWSRRPIDAPPHAPHVNGHAARARASSHRLAGFLATQPQSRNSTPLSLNAASSSQGGAIISSSRRAASRSEARASAVAFISTARSAASISISMSSRLIDETRCVAPIIDARYVSPAYAGASAPAPRTQKGAAASSQVCRPSCVDISPSSKKARCTCANVGARSDGDPCSTTFRGVGDAGDVVSKGPVAQRQDQRVPSARRIRPKKPGTSISRSRLPRSGRGTQGRGANL